MTNKAPFLFRKPLGTDRALSKYGQWGSEKRYQFYGQSTYHVDRRDLGPHKELRIWQQSRCSITLFSKYNSPAAASLFLVSKGRNDQETH